MPFGISKPRRSSASRSGRGATITTPLLACLLASLLPSIAGCEGAAGPGPAVADATLPSDDAAIAPDTGRRLLPDARTGDDGATPGSDASTMADSGGARDASIARDAGGRFAAPDIYSWSFEGGSDVDASGDLTDGGSTPFLVRYPAWHRDATMAASGSQSVRVDVPPGQNDYGGTIYYDTRGRYARLFIRYYIRFSPGYSLTDNCKIVRVYRDLVPLGPAVFSFVKSNTFDTWLGLWDRWYSSGPTSPIRGGHPSDAYGEFTYLEFEYDMRDYPTGATVRAWVGTADDLIVEHTVVPMERVDDMRLVHLFGVADSLDATTTESVWVDDVAISTRRIGP